jgi:predicted O-methyltransferase YrrM
MSASPQPLYYNSDQRHVRIIELLNTRRLEFKRKQSNTTRGLYEMITKYVDPKYKIVELGSFAGVSSELFALFCAKLYCVDRWEPYREIKDNDKLATAEQRFDSMHKNYSHIVKLKMDSLDAASQFAGGSIDMVYIDTDHSSEQVEREIDAWLPKIKNSGFIAGHDFNMPTVFNVVTQHFEPTLIEIFNDTSWITSVKNTL